MKIKTINPVTYNSGLTGTTTKNVIGVITNANQFNDGKTLVINYHYKDEIIKAPFQFEWSANEEASAIKLVNGRMNLFFGEVTSFHQNLKRLGYSKDIIQLKPEIYKIPVYLAFAKKLDFSKADQEKALLKSQAFAKGMQMFKRTEQYQILLNKYSNIFAN